MSDSGVENGAKYEELAQRVARLEGAVGDGRGYRRNGHPWWMFWALLWLAFPLMGRFPVVCSEFGSSWRTVWPVGVLLVIVVVLLVRDRSFRAPDQGGKR